MMSAQILHQDASSDRSPRDKRYDVLFEPVQIGPVTAKNRFYQVPHCTGLGRLRPRMLAALRGMKAEGGWAVVCTEYCSIHPTSDDFPHAYASLWNRNDIANHALMTEAVHRHGALAGVELWFGGAHTANLYTRQVPMDVAGMPNSVGHPYQARAMDKADIRELRRWYREAALRAKEAGFDVVYVYATHGYLLSHFLSPRTNTRSDEYGGSMENRTRLLRELIEETKDAVGERCAVAVRYSVGGDDGEDASLTSERRDRLEMLGRVAPRMASGIHREEGLRVRGIGGRRRSGGSGSSACAWLARIPGNAGGGDTRARWPRGPRSHAAGSGRVASGATLSAAAD